jgi:murein DD-endopeptidase MepM/ murein hydrolase activator NlpD
VISLISYYVLQLSGIGKIILPGQDKMSSEDQEKIELLNEKIIFLAQELQSLKTTNEKLRYALILGDSSLIDSIPIPDSTMTKKNPPVGGDILGAIIKLVRSSNTYQSDEILFIKPVEGFISRKFNPASGHHGIDIVLREGTSVFATAGGFVIFADFTIDYGYTIILSHTTGYISVYKHCSALLKKQREIVVQGELIALSGNSGYKSTGPHLHFEIWREGVPINPETVLTKY